MRHRKLRVRGLHAAIHVQRIEPVCGLTFASLQPIPVQWKYLLRCLCQRRTMCDRKLLREC